MWKTNNKITGVSDSTLVDLRAALYEKEQGGKRAKEIDDKKRPTKRLKLSQKDPKVKDTLGPSNRGVSERAKRDEFSRDSVRTLEESEAKLRMKSEIYEKSKRGELWDGEEEAGFLVDFEEKKWEERAKNVSELMALPVESRKRIANATLSSKWKTVEAYRDEAEYEQAREERRLLIEHLAKQTEQNRQRHLQAKKLRRTMAEKRRKQIALLHPHGEEEPPSDSKSTEKAEQKKEKQEKTEKSRDDEIQENKEQAAAFLQSIRKSLKNENPVLPTHDAEHGTESWNYGNHR